MPLNSRGAIDPRWTKHAASALKGFQVAKIQVIDPHTEGVTANPWTNQLSSAPEVVWEGWGQLQVFRQTLNAEMPAGAITQVRSLRFTVPIDGPTVPIRKGMIVKVIEVKAPFDNDALNYQYTVTSGINAALAFTRTIEAESDMGVII